MLFFGFRYPLPLSLYQSQKGEGRSLPASAFGNRSALFFGSCLAVPADVVGGLVRSRKFGFGGFAFSSAAAASMRCIRKNLSISFFYT
ncbi:MAG: hypothetical protein GH151_06635 [Bacteroidetes bacterium]|nr:hypothetical protein [Bacteroidota bacterium]